MEFIDISRRFAFASPSSPPCFAPSSFFPLLLCFHLPATFILLLFSSQFLLSSLFFAFFWRFLVCVFAFCAVKLLERSWRGCAWGVGGVLLMGWIFVYLIFRLCHDRAENQPLMFRFGQFKPWGNKMFFLEVISKKVRASSFWWFSVVNSVYFLNIFFCLTHLNTPYMIYSNPSQHLSILLMIQVLATFESGMSSKDFLDEMGTQTDLEYFLIICTYIRKWL